MAKTVLIIGGGASGLMAAISAKQADSDAVVVIIERLDRVGKKLLATGNGRCNFSNLNTSVENYYGKNPDFVMPALKEFSVDNTINFFNSIGIFPREEQQGKLYPYSLQATAVLDALRQCCDNLGVQIITGKTVKEIIQRKKGFKLILHDNDNEQRISGDAVIVAGGGCSSPALGSDGSCYKLLKKLGHNITKLSPALVQVKTDLVPIKGMQGIKIEGLVTLISGNKVIGSEYGEILFTDYGLSGPPVFQLSAKMPFRKNLVLSLDFMNEYPLKNVYEILEGRKHFLGKQTMENFFVGLLNKRLGNLIARSAGIEKLSYPVKNLDKDMLWNMARLIKEYKIDVISLNGFNNAQVTAGGVATDEFNIKTMESIFVENLFCCGEIFDIHGDCGGYNLQWAWSSGYVAGKNAVQ